jgi:hypothetical protein
VNGDGILAGTTHPELAQLLGDAGCLVVSSAADLARRLSEREPRGIFVSQDLPGLSVERVTEWATGRAGRVAVWLEPDPGAAWLSACAGCVVWVGDLPAAELETWLTHAGETASWGMEGGVHVVLESAPSPDGVARALAWAEGLAARFGPGLVVDADWATGLLTERVDARVWPRGSLSPTRWRLGRFWPAPPPWEVSPPDPGRDVMEDLVRQCGAWTVAYLGGDIRPAPAVRWISLARFLVWIPRGASAVRAAHLRTVLGEINPDMRIAVLGSPAMAQADRLSPGWPSWDPVGSEGGERRPWSRWTMRAPRLFGRFGRRSQPPGT